MPRSGCNNHCIVHRHDLRDQKGEKMKLTENHNGRGYVTSYRMIIGCAEARKLGFLGEDKKPLELKKIVDAENHRLIIEPDSLKEVE